MGKILFIDDITHPKMGSAMSIKPIIDSYIRRYELYLAKDIKVYCFKEKDKYIVHSQVPSEKNGDYDKPIFYDVVIEFYPVDKLNKDDLTLKSYGVKLYCNSPSWMFDFTYIFAKADCIPSFVPKKYYSKAALIEPPKKKNPLGLFGIDRVVFSAFYNLEINTGFRKNRMEMLTMPNMNSTKVLKKIMGQEEKLDQINYEHRKAVLKRKAEKKKAKLKQPEDLNIINKKENELGRLRNDLDKRFGSEFEENFNNYEKNDLKGNMITSNGLGNLKGSLKSKLTNKKK